MRALQPSSAGSSTTGSTAPPSVQSPRHVGRIAAVLVALALFQAPPTASGQQSAQAEAQQGGDGQQGDLGADARTLFLQGAEAYGQGRFEDALRLFRQAYERAPLQPRVVLLVNIAQTLDKLGREEEALEYYERYIELMPSGPKAPVVQARIDVLRRRLAERRELEEARRREAMRASETPSPVAPVTEATGAPAAEAASEDDGVTWWPWAVAGGVAVAGGIVAVLLLTSGGDGGGCLPSGPCADWAVEALR